jgi:hypothetical protein
MSDAQGTAAMLAADGWRSRAARLVVFVFGDVIAAAHVFMIAGMVLYDPDGQVIPPIHTMTTREPLELLLISFLAYQAGRILALRPWRRGAAGVAARPAPQEPGPALVVVACCCAAAVLAIQVWNVVTRGSLADVAFAKAEAGETLGPLNRIIYGVLPFLAGLLYYTTHFHRRWRRLALLLCGVCLVGLALTLFKISVVLFLLQLMYLTLIARGERTPSLGALLRSPRVALAVAGLAVGMYYLSEGEDLAMSFRIVLSRALVFSWEGFAYVVETPALPDLADQWSVFTGAVSSPSPDVLLATDMLGLDPPPIGIVVTLPGFLFRNFGALGVAVGALGLGVLAQQAISRATRESRPSAVLLWVSSYFACVEAFLVGNVFNTLRGTVVTLLFTFVLAAILERRTAANEWRAA